MTTSILGHAPTRTAPTSVALADIGRLREGAKVAAGVLAVLALAAISMFVECQTFL